MLAQDSRRNGLETALTVLNIRILKEIIATEPQSHRIALKCCVIFKNVALSATFLNLAKYGAITTKFQVTGTGAELHRKRKLIQFNYAQYCISIMSEYVLNGFFGMINSIQPFKNAFVFICCPCFSC